jgi:hypothetical protein
MAEQQPEQISFHSELRRYADASPFVPFDIITTSGDHYEVRERLQVLMFGDSLVVATPKTGLQIIRKNQVTAIHAHEAE